MASYSSSVAAIHKKFAVQLRRARSAKSVRTAYSAHARAHKRLLKRHLLEEKRAADKKAKQLSRKK